MIPLLLLALTLHAAPAKHRRPANTEYAAARALSIGGGTAYAAGWVGFAPVSVDIFATASGGTVRVSGVF